MSKKRLPILCILSCYCIFHNSAFAFSFSEEEEKERNEENAQALLYKQQSTVPASCLNAVKKKKIAVIIGESHISAGRIIPIIYSNYGMHFQILNGKLSDLGLKTYTPEEINKQIAQEEISAALNNDPDAAITAATRLGANFIIRGVINSRGQYNPVARTKEVFVNLNFSMSDASGRTVSNVAVGGDAWSGADTISSALLIVKEKAGYVAGKLIREYCINK